MLKSLEKAHFVEAIPQMPMGKYAHIIVLRETQSFPLFQTDGGLNVVRVNAGLTHQQPWSRIMIFKRKQSSPERLNGRELLRRYGLIEKDKEGNFLCDYNENFCTKCPDCIYYGFAIGDSGSEKSKVIIDTAYSLTGYDESHQQFSFNALYEEGKMTREGDTRSSFGEQDHVLPQVFFPSVITVKDATEAEFIYVLNNILRTKSYGAQTTRTGKVENHIVGIVFADGEIFSNLKLTQAITDKLLKDKETLESPLNPLDVQQAAETVLPELLKQDGVVYALYYQEKLRPILEEIKAITMNENDLKAILQQAAKETEAYHTAYIKKSSSKKKGQAAKSEESQSSML